MSKRNPKPGKTAIQIMNIVLASSMLAGSIHPGISIYAADPEVWHRNSFSGASKSSGGEAKLEEQYEAVAHQLNEAGQTEQADDAAGTQQSQGQQVQGQQAQGQQSQGQQAQDQQEGNSADTIQEPNVSEEDAVFEQELAAFPESYHESLRKLHEAHPNWHFIAQDTGTDWSQAVYEEYKFGEMLPEQNVGWWGTRAVSLTWNSNISSWKSTEEGAYDWEIGRWTTGWDGSSLVIASQEIVEHFLDPRNFLTEDGIFQFLSFRYNGDMTLEDVEEAAERGVAPYLTGVAVNPDGSRIYYPEAILTAAEKTGVHPFYLIATISLENGVNGYRTNQINGDAPGYEGLFNYYNIAAYQDSEHGFDYAWERGLWFAGGEDRGNTSYYRPWDNRQDALTGGASYFARNYLNAGQDTYYLKRFNVLSTAREQFNHQFSTDIEGAANETRIFASLFSDKVKEGELTFYIPYFRDMPEEACPMPTDDTDPREREQAAFEDRVEFASKLYRQFAGRKGDTDELYVAALDLAKGEAADIAYSIIFSEEARAREISDAGFVQGLFLALLDMEPKHDIVSNYVSELEKGASRQKIFAEFVALDAFAERCESLKLDPGTYSSAGWDFVVYLYRNVLGREPSYREVENWVVALVDRGYADKFAHSLFFSVEAKNKYAENEEFISVLYNVLLHREARQKDIDLWLDYINIGCTREFIFYGVVASPEFANLWAESGLKTGGWKPKDVRDRYPKLTRFVSRLYDICIGRRFDSKGLAKWVQFLVDGASGAQTLKGFIHSQEFINMTVDDAEYVRRLYQAVLARDPDETGMAAWLAELETGVTRDDVFWSIVASPEFDEVCGAYGIEP